MFDEEDVLAASAATVVILSAVSVAVQLRRRRRRFWVRPSLLNGRRKYSATDFMKDLILDDEDLLSLEYRSGAGFQKFFRMSASTFEEILNLIAPRLKVKVDTKMRDAIPIRERLACTLRFLATGDSYHSLQYSLKISKQVISQCVPEVCDAIVETMKDYIKMPRNHTEWREIEKTYQKWNFPHCLGAIDGKHIALQAPVGSGTEYFNYKGFFSVVLLAIVDGNYRFIYANVGCQGRISDGGILQATSFKKCLDDMTINLPALCSLPGRTADTPYVFLADDAFPLSTNIMKPYPGNQNKGSKQRIFNYRLSRARRVSENVFGIISSVYRVLRKPMLLEPKIATKVVLAIIHLHNFLRQSSSRKIYNPPGTFDGECSDTGVVTDGIWKKDQPNSSGLTNFRSVARKSKMEAEDVRNEFAEYFCSPEGEVNFQYDRA